MLRFRFCPRCRTQLEPKAMHDGIERLVCPNCGFVHYENSKPTAGAIVVRDGRVLLAERKHEPAKGKWDILGGFLHKGEHPEAGVVREIREETGLEIRPVALIGMYIDTYGDGPDSDPILNIYYEAEVVSGTPEASDDVAALRWFDPSDLPVDWAFEHQPRVIADWKRMREA